MMAKAVIVTPATEPTVLTKKTWPAPPSPASVFELRIAISSGFIADSAINGKANRIALATKLPAIRSNCANAGNNNG